MQFSTNVAHLSNHPVNFYWSMSSNRKSEPYLGPWHPSSDNDACERPDTSEFEIKRNSAISSVWLTSFKCWIHTWSPKNVLNLLLFLSIFNLATFEKFLLKNVWQSIKSINPLITNLIKYHYFIKHNLARVRKSC